MLLDAFVTDRELISIADRIGRKLPFSVSSLQKDRCTGCLGGVPYRRIGGKAIYVPQQVFEFLDRIEIAQPRVTAMAKKQGASTKRERVDAALRGISVRELRANGGSK